MPRRAALLSLTILLAALPAAAQTPATAPPDRPGPYVIDVRGALIGAPQGSGFYPPVPSGTIAPTREFGVDIGGHVYLLQWRAARIGLGADWIRLRGTATPLEVKGNEKGEKTPQSEAETPATEISTSTIAPQLSLNFGSAQGWSYVSLGFGRAQITSKRSVFDDGGEQTREGGSVSSWNFGGGARWFTSDHLAFTFDVRFHRVSLGKPQGTLPRMPRTTLVSIAAGISLR